jgi:periplasmic protein CpxP/Spy
MKPEVAEIVATELKQFAAELNLSDEQKAHLKPILENAREKMDELREKQDVTKADVIAKFVEVRGSLRERIVKFLTPEQLSKWDAMIAKAKSFLGHPVKS